MFEISRLPVANCPQMSAIWPSLKTMPGGDAKRGDVYLVDKTATLDQADTRDAHPMVCVAEMPVDPAVWKGMPRVTTGAQPEDLPSPRRSDLPFTLDGYWTFRFIRAVKKPLTGHPALCPFKGTLPEPLRTEVLAHYKSRPRPTEHVVPRTSAH